MIKLLHTGIVTSLVDVDFLRPKRRGTNRVNLLDDSAHKNQQIVNTWVLSPGLSPIVAKTSFTGLKSWKSRFDVWGRSSNSQNVLLYYPQIIVNLFKLQALNFLNASINSFNVNISQTLNEQSNKQA